MKYRAFISYKHVSSTAFAENLELAIKAYAKPIWRAPIKIFRDEKYLKPGMNLPKLIQTALDDSEYLIYLASPDAAQSKWVEDELEFWCNDEDRMQRLIVVLTDGLIIENPNTMQVDWEQTNALPKSIAPKIDMVPFYVDLSWAKTNEMQSLLNPGYKKAINAIVATLRNIDPIELTWVEILQHRKNIRLKNTLITSIALLAIGLAFVAVFAWNEMRKAEWRATYSESLRLAESSPNLAAHTLGELPDNAKVAAAPLAWRIINDTPIWTTTEFRGHGGELWSLAFDPEGRLATGGGDGTVRLWTLNNSRPPLVLPRHNTLVIDMAFSQDGKLLATASEVDAIRVWDTKTEALLTVFPDTINQINQVIANPKGKGFLAASYGHLQLFDESGTQKTLASIPKLIRADWSPDGTLIATASSQEGVGAQLHRLDGSSPPLALEGTQEAGTRAVQFSPDGSRIAVICMDGTLRFFKSPDGSLLQTVQQDPLPPKEKVSQTARRLVRFSRNGDVLAAAFGRKLYLWTVTTTSNRKVLTHVNAIKDFDLSTDGQHIITLDSQGAAYLWDQEAIVEEKATPLKGHAGISRVAFTPDGSRAVTTGQNGTVRLWNYSQPMVPVTILKGHMTTVKYASFSPDGTKVVTTSDDGSAKLWNVDDGALLATLQRELWSKMASAIFSPDGEQIIVAGSAGVFLWPSNGQEEAQQIYEGPVFHAAFSIDGKHLLVPTRGIRNISTDSLYLYPADGNGLPKSFAGESQFSDYSPLSPDGTRLLTISWEARQAYLHNLVNGTTDTLKGHKSFVLDASFSPDGRNIVTSSSDMTIRLWDVETAKELTVFNGGGAEVELARFLPDGTKILTTSAEQTVRIWDKEGHILRQIQPQGIAYQMDLSKDSKKLLVVENDRQKKYHAVRVLDMETEGAPVLLTGHTNDIRYAAFSPDGKRIVTTSEDGTARIYPIDWPTLRKTLLKRSPQIYEHID